MKNRCGVITMLGLIWMKFSSPRPLHMHIENAQTGPNNATKTANIDEKIQHLIRMKGATKNAGVENAIRSKLQGWKMQEWKMQE